MHLDNTEAGKVFGMRHEFKVLWARVLGGYIGYDNSKRDFLRERTLIWEKNIGTIIKTIVKCPQLTYVAVAHAIQL